MTKEKKIKCYVIQDTLGKSLLSYALNNTETL